MHVTSALVLQSVLLFAACALAGSDGACNCVPSPKDFGDIVHGNAKGNCRHCYLYKYELSANQNWTSQLCVSSELATPQDPLYVVVRESINVMAFQLPVIFRDIRPQNKTCRTLCPLPNHKDFDNGTSVLQEIVIEVTTNSDHLQAFEFTLSKKEDFLIQTGDSRNVSVSITQPAVLLYKLDDNVRSVQIQAKSETSRCMALAVQNVQCPIYDYAEAIDNTDLFQSSLTKAAITVSKMAFHGDQIYVILYLKSTDKHCLTEYIPNGFENQTNEVILSVVPSMPESSFYIGISVTIVVILLIAILVYIFDHCLRKHACLKNTDCSSCCLCEWLISKLKKCLKCFKPGNVYVNHLSQQDDADVIKKSSQHYWYAIVVAIFYSLPAMQLVYKYKETMSLTGNQDLCYYNFLCSYAWLGLMDFNHVFSNFGYIVLGVLFIVMVKCRKDSYTKRHSEKTRLFLAEISSEQRPLNPASGDVAVTIPQNNARLSERIQLTGVLQHFGILYAMGVALLMQGVLSGCYHVCPTQANFQFDTTFMYVISILGMMKLWSSRHSDRMPRPQKIWLLVALASFTIFLSLIFGSSLWYVFIFVHFVVTIYISLHFYNSQPSFSAWKAMTCRAATTNKLQQLKAATGKRVMFWLFIILNIAFDICVAIITPDDFATFFLYIFLSNALVHTLYYLIMKFSYEKLLVVPLLLMLLSIVLWPFAIYFFVQKRWKWELTPAESRLRNTECDRFIFDAHDWWHFLSSAAVFCSYLVFMTVDNDLKETPRNEIMVF